MFENNNQQNENNQITNDIPTSEMSFTPDSDAQKSPKKKKHTFAKAVAFVACLVFISTGSIYGYKYMVEDGGIENITSTFGINDKDDDNDESSEDENSKDNAVADASSKEESSESSSLSSDSNKSWVTLSSRKNALSAPEIYEKVIPSVVGITSTFNEGTGTGTGIVMTKDGYIITNAHVVEYTTTQTSSNYGGYGGYYGYSDPYANSTPTQTKEQASKIVVTLSDENKTEYEAKVVGCDSESDIAVLKIEAKDLTPAEFGDSDDLKVGEDIIAIGNPLGFELFGSLTKGVISALDREVTVNDNTMNLIQIDAAINSGNSGGPLINCYGQVVGINSAKMSSNYTSSSASIEGLGFAIPITDAKKIINDLINCGYVTGKPQLGITCQTSGLYGGGNRNINGVEVISVSSGGAADKAGVKVGDIIIGIQDESVTTPDELNAIKNKYNAGDKITLTIMRDSKQVTVDVTLDEQPVQNNS